MSVVLWLAVASACGADSTPSNGPTAPIATPRAERSNAPAPPVPDSTPDAGTGTVERSYCAALEAPWVRDGDRWDLQPTIRFEIDSTALSRQSVATLEAACAMLPPPVDRIEVDIVVHPQVADFYAERSLDLPRARARSMEHALTELSCADDVRGSVIIDDTRPERGPAEVRLRLWGCR